jgi:deoxyadenosine/deoxycytidine kinase
MNSVEEALECVQKGKVVGFMEFPDDYSEQLQIRFLTGRFAENETLRESTIQFRMDMSS